MANVLDYEERYDLLNIPKTSQAALERLNEVLCDVAHITCDIGMKSADEYETAAEYRNWKSRARGALAFACMERDLLENWLNGHYDAMLARVVAEKTVKKTVPVLVMESAH